MYWLGIDVGTGGTRALLLNETGKIVAGCTAAHAEMRMEKALWAEQDPEDWWRAAKAAIRAVLQEANADGSSIQGIGFSGQMHGLVMLDGNGQVIRPSLIWCDQRSQTQVDAIHARVGRERVVQFTANPSVTGFTLPKLLWVRDHEPASFERLRTVLLPKDYVRFRLSGEVGQDVSDASGTGLFDVVQRRWSRPMIEELGLDSSWFPPIYESAQVCGRVTTEAAEATGLLAGTPMVTGAGDQAASAVGNGIVESGIASCTLGTSGVVFAHMDQPAYDPGGRVHTFCHAVPGKWHVMGVTQGAGLSLQWFRNTLAPGTSYDALMAEAAEAELGSGGLFWLPYLMGERTPHLDALARGGWVGLTARHQRRDLVRSIVEGVTFSQRDCLDVILELGVEVNRVRASGGGAQSSFWRQVMADVFARRVTTLDSQEGSAYGAGLLAMVGTGGFSSVHEACAACTNEVTQTDPRPREGVAYARAHEIYRTLYPTLKSTFRLL
ncbi:xylulokinase [Bryobacter aggregatus]|uniref:xylulokinase n=1 Tax=Bryobacter aggregatus TaxID=360054 RepID=UPI0004E14234|nr:xylulokinase [Bryobacter aggregatus]